VASQIPTQAPFPTTLNADDVANEVIAQMPVINNTLMYVVVVAVVIAILIGVVNLVLLRKKQT
jgi:hypothetical protein